MDELDQGFECLGYAVYCDNCGSRHHFDADSLTGALVMARKKGLVIIGDAQFCSQACADEDKGVVCLHSYSRSNPTICVKCGDKRKT